MSEFIYLFRSTADAASAAMGTAERAQQSMQTWLAWIRELEAAGHLRDPGQPLDRAGKVVGGKDRVISDGPYVEVKDVVLGFIVVEARDLDHATALAAGCPILDGGGSVEVRPVNQIPI